MSGWPGTVALSLFAGFYLASAIGVEIGFHRYFTHRAFKCGPTLRLVARGVRLHGRRRTSSIRPRRTAVIIPTPTPIRIPRRPTGPGTGRILARACRLAVRAATAGRRTLRTRSHPRPDELDGEPVLSAVVHAGPRAAGRDRLRVRRRAWRARGTAVGRRGPDLRRAPGNLEHQTRCAICSVRGPTPRATTAATSGRLRCRPWAGHGADNHHAFPRSAFNDFTWWQVDPSAWLIRLAEALGLVWDVRRPRPKSMHGDQAA